MLSVVKSFLFHRRTRASELWREDAAFIAASGLFDPAYYLSENPDVAASGIDALEHYLRFGEAELRQPSASFDTRYYVESNPDVLASGMSPLRHFCEFGVSEGRLPLPPQGDVPAPTAPSAATGEDVARSSIERSGLFDARFYIAKYPHVAESGLDPLDHYLRVGAAAGFDPSARFSTEYYLSENSDVAHAGVNPLAHFCRHGWKELRDPSPDFDMGIYWALHLIGTVDAEGDPLSHYRDAGGRLGLEVFPVAAPSKELSQRLLERCQWALAQGVASELVARRLAKILTRLRKWPLVEKAWRIVLGFNWREPKAHARLAEAFERQGRWWQAAESLAIATNLDSRHPEWYFRLGEAQEKMKRYALAVDAYRAAIGEGSRNPLWHYRLGYALEQAGEVDASRSSYEQAMQLDRKHSAGRLGEGVFHQLREYWPEARDAYEAWARRVPTDPEIWYRLGLANDRCFEWEAACAAYEKAVALKPDAAYWHYRLGYVLERQRNWLAAAEAYEAAIILSSKPVPYWHYRRGYVLTAAGEFKAASEAFLGGMPDGLKFELLPAGHRKRISNPKFAESLLAEDRTDARRYVLLARQYEYAERWVDAADAYSGAVLRESTHDPSLYWLLGHALSRLGSYQRACQAFTETVILRRPLGIDSRRYSMDPHQKMLMAYSEYRDCLPVRKGTILYESFAGLSISDNPLAVFERMLEGEGVNWMHVWVVSEDTPIPEWLRTLPNVALAVRGSDLYLRYLATASHLVNNSTFPSWFIRRPEQRYLNTWHGTPLKTLMKDIRGSFMERTNSARNLLQCTHLISPNQHTSDVLLRGGDVASIFSGHIAETGYPRIDRMINATEGSRNRLRQRLGLTSDLPVVLYAPTWRGRFGSGDIEVERVISDLERMSEVDCQILFRGHYTVAAKLDSLALPVKVVPQSIESCDVLSITDVLVTDYSSIFFDFLPRGRPIVYYAYDLSEYAEHRGLYLDMAELPGILCTDPLRISGVIKEAISQIGGVAEEYARAAEKFCPYEDGRAAQRVVDFFLRDDTEHMVGRYRDERTSVLMYAGAFPPQGITTSALNLLGIIDTTQDVVTVVVDPGAVASAPERLERFGMMPSETRVVGRTGALVDSAEERWVRGIMNRRHSLPNERMRDVYLRSCRREFERAFGSARFDAIIDFDGYSIFWASLLGVGGSSETRKVMYMHSDMYAEYTLKFPSLQGLFSMFSLYDCFVAVSERLRDVNRASLVQHFGLDANKFMFCENAIDIESVQVKALAPLDQDVVGFVRGRTAFLALGRLSPEKDHAKLLRAFASVISSDESAVLLIVGDGPIRQDIEQLILQLNLQDSVFMAGARLDPFPILAACDCLVMSSNHEGQPMVILEAMALGVPVVATDIEGNRGILSPNGYGLLVENSESGLAEGMLAFLHGDVPKGRFDSEAYQRRVLGSFQRVLARPQ